MREIDKNTQMFSVVSYDSTKSKLLPALNYLFAENSINAVAIIMSVRADDFGFFMSNVKNSQIKSTLLEREFREEAFEFIENRDSKFIDSIDIKDTKLYGFNTEILAISNLIGDSQKLAIIGANEKSKELILNLNSNSKVQNITICENSPESALIFINSLKALGVDIDFDIERVIPKIEIELSNFDIVVNFDLKSKYNINSLNLIELKDINYRILIEKVKIDFERWFGFKPKIPDNFQEKLELYSMEKKEV